jgi:hypothetical protein
VAPNTQVSVADVAWSILAAVVWVLASYYVYYCATFVLVFSDVVLSSTVSLVVDAVVFGACAALGALFVRIVPVLRPRSRLIGILGAVGLLMLGVPQSLGAVNVDLLVSLLPLLVGGAIFIALLWRVPSAAGS